MVDVLFQPVPVKRIAERSSGSQDHVSGLKARSTFSVRLSAFVNSEWNVPVLVVQPNVWQSSMPRSEPVVEGAPGASGTTRTQASFVLVTVKPSKQLGLPVLRSEGIAPIVRSTS